MPRRILRTGPAVTKGGQDDDDAYRIALLPLTPNRHPSTGA